MTTGFPPKVRHAESAFEQFRVVKLSEVAGWWNTRRPLTHSLDYGKEGLAVDATRICSIDGCNGKFLAKGLCSKHYERQRRTGSAELKKKPEYDRCTVSDCDRSTRSRHSPYCETHYYRLRRNGTLEAVAPRAEGNCTIGPCNRPAYTVAGECRIHYLRRKRNGDYVRRVQELHPYWTGDDATYRAVHQRVRVRFGSARNYRCVDCGKAARHWSYDHGCPNEKYDAESGPYSTDIDRYHPRCVRCHKRFDLGRERKGAS